MTSSVCVCVSCARNAVCGRKGTSGLCLHHLSLVAGHCYLHSLPVVQPADEGKILTCVCVSKKTLSSLINLSPIPGPSPSIGQTLHPFGHFVAGMLLLLVDGASAGQ